MIISPMIPSRLLLMTLVSENDCTIFDDHSFWMTLTSSIIIDCSLCMLLDFGMYRIAMKSLSSDSYRWYMGYSLYLSSAWVLYLGGTPPIATSTWRRLGGRAGDDSTISYHTYTWRRFGGRMTTRLISYLHVAGVDLWRGERRLDSKA